VTEVTIGLNRGQCQKHGSSLAEERWLALLRWLDIRKPPVTLPGESAFSVEHRAQAPSVAAWDILLASSSVSPGESHLGRIQSLISPARTQPVDWDAVLQLADQHGVSSLLHQNLSRLGDSVPSAVQATLRQRHETNVLKSLFLARELICVLDHLDAFGVEVIPYKGIVMSEVYYGDMALRQSGDMDLFVHERDVARIKNAVRDLGYTARVPIPQNAERAYVASGYECTFDHPLGKNLLELQWALQPRFYAVDFDMEGMLGRALSVTVAGRAVKTPSPEDLLLVLSVHAAKHVWGRLIWLCDIAQILKLETLNWDRIESRARALGIERILHITLLLANRFLKSPMPAPIEKAIEADAAARTFTDEIAVSVAAGVSYEEEQISYFRLMMRLRERPMDRLRFLTRLTFTPGPGEWEAVRLPKPLFPLYRLVRLARLAFRFARG
jgi:putative nucleotidyltransferase-like protein